MPVYNVEHYLRRCLDSLLRQGVEKMGGYEIICVNDGSTDESPAILNEYQQRLPHIVKVLSSANKGVAQARNAGLESARGKYVTFCDSDDYVVDGGYAYLLNIERGRTAQPTPASAWDGAHDVVSFWSVTVNEYQKRHWVYDDKPDGVVLCEGEGNDLYNESGETFVWNKLYRRSFLEEHNLKFEPVAVSEDTWFCYSLFRCNPRTLRTNCNIYRYMQDNAHSLIRDSSPDPAKISDQLRFIAELNDYLCHGGGKIRQGVMRTLHGQVLMFHTRSLASRLSYHDWAHHMGQLRRFPYHHTAMSGKWWLVGLMLNAASCSFLLYKLLAALYIHVFNCVIRHRLA